MDGTSLHYLYYFLLVLLYFTHNSFLYFCEYISTWKAILCHLWMFYTVEAMSEYILRRLENISVKLRLFSYNKTWNKSTLYKLKYSHSSIRPINAYSCNPHQPYSPSQGTPCPAVDLFHLNPRSDRTALYPISRPGWFDKWYNPDALLSLSQAAQCTMGRQTLQEKQK